MQPMIQQPEKVDEKNQKKEVQHGGKPEGADPVENTGDTITNIPLQDTGQDIR